MQTKRAQSIIRHQRTLPKLLPEIVRPDVSNRNYAVEACQAFSTSQYAKSCVLTGPARLASHPKQFRRQCQRDLTYEQNVHQ